MATLRTDYVDDILAAAMDGKRQYQMIQNSNGTVSFVDVTDYTQNGDVFSSGDVNNIDTQINTNTGNIATNASNIIINANKITAASRRTRRDITSDIQNLRNAVLNQDLASYGYAIGDYFVGASGYKYVLAHMNKYYNMDLGGEPAIYITTPHISLVVNTSYYDTYDNVRSYANNTVKANIESDLSGLGVNLNVRTIPNHRYVDVLLLQFIRSQIPNNYLDDYSSIYDKNGNMLEVFSKYSWMDIFDKKSVWLREKLDSGTSGLTYRAVALTTGAIGEGIVENSISSRVDSFYLSGYVVLEAS